MRKICIALIKLSVVVGLLGGVYQLMGLFNKVLVPDSELNTTLRSTTATAGPGENSKKDDAKSFFDKQQKLKEQGGAKQNEDKSKSALRHQYDANSQNLAITTAEYNRVVNSGFMNKVTANGTVGKVPAAERLQSQVTKSAATPATTSETVSSDKAMQRVSGTPGEPLVTGSLPLGDGLKFLLLLCVGYTIRLFLVKM